MYHYHYFIYLFYILGELHMPSFLDSSNYWLRLSVFVITARDNCFVVVDGEQMECTVSDVISAR